MVGALKQRRLPRRLAYRGNATHPCTKRAPCARSGERPGPGDAAVGAEDASRWRRLAMMMMMISIEDPVST